MKHQRALVVLTVVNLLLLAFNISQQWSVSAAQSSPSMLRGSGLEIVDKQGRVRAMIGVLPPGKMPTGGAYPETVILRLIDERGKPKVKLGTSDLRSGLGLLGDSDATQALIEAEGQKALVKLTNGNGRQQITTP
jgi:hypothetical protein